MPEIEITSINGFDEVLCAFRATAHGREVNVTPMVAYMMQHSPIRERRFRIEGVWADSVHVHLVRHHVGVEHYVDSHRPDRGYEGEDGRDAPRAHMVTLNAESLINIAQKRLCYAAEGPTNETFRMIKQSLQVVDFDLSCFLVPQCVYRNGLCAEGSRSCGCLAQNMEEYAYYKELGFITC